MKYSENRAEFLENNNTYGKRATLESGTLQKLVARSITRFKIEGEFEVPRQTIFSRMKADRLEVWHTGETSPIILVEVLYDAYYCAIFGGAEFCRLRDSILRFETISTY